ncbi:uracil phosphoribosyltransferase [Patescibacteria group bacterium]
MIKRDDPAQNNSEDDSFFLNDVINPWQVLSTEELSQTREFCDLMKEKGRFKVLDGIPDEMRRDWVEGVEDGAISNVLITPERFRELSDQVCKELVDEVLKDENGEVMVVYPWRAALSFLSAFVSHGIENHCHFGVCRNEETLEIEVYMPLKEDIFRSSNVDTIILADPMLATGGSFDTLMKILKSVGVSENKIKIVSVVGAPEGVKKILSKYPGVEITVAALDGYLNEMGRIVEPGLGDYGDKWLDRLDIEDFISKYSNYFSEKELEALRDRIEFLRKSTSVS